MVLSNKIKSDLGRIENLTEENFEKIFYILCDIKKQIRFSLSDKAKIYLVVPREKAKGYFVWDRRLWKSDILEVLEYFVKLGVITSYSFPESELYADVVLDVPKYTKALVVAEKRNNLKFDRIIKFEPLDKPDGKILIQYDIETGLLSLGHDTVQLQKDAFNAKMIELLLRNEKNRKKLWSWDEIIEIIEMVNPADSVKEYRGKFYNACVGIKKTISSNTKINDLLLYTRQSVRVNPKFI